MWWQHEDAQERQDGVQRQIEKRRARGERLEALAAPTGKKLCTTFWGQAWCRNLESYQVYEARLPRGRSYLRQGKVYDLEIEPMAIRAVVAGAELYETSVRIQKLPEESWQEIVEASAGEVASMLDLLAGKLGDGLMQLLTDPERGLFPKPKEIRFVCTCTDDADLCKHASAVLYGVGVMLDTQPELLFTLRGVDQVELLANASSTTITDLSAGEGDLAGTDLSALFGIELGDLEMPVEKVAQTPTPEPPPRPAKKAVARKAQGQKGPKRRKGPEAG